VGVAKSLQHNTCLYTINGKIVSPTKLVCTYNSFLQNWSNINIFGLMIIFNDFMNDFALVNQWHMH